MISVSSTFLAALRYPHSIKTTVTANPPSGNPVTLPVEDGTVTIDRTADHRRQLDLLIADESYYPMRTSDPIAPYGTELVVSCGLRFAHDFVEDVPLGVFRIEEASRDVPGGGVQITGWDRSRQVLDQRFLKPRALASQTAVALIQLLIRQVYPDAIFEVLTGDATTIPKHVVDRDRWAEVQRVAQVIGCEVFATETGTWRIQDVPDPRSAVPVWAVDAGEAGVLIGATDSVSREAAPNIVVAIGESVSGNNPPVTSQLPHGYDTNPLSPTYYLGAYGVVPRFYSSPHIRTQAQADRVADAQLADHLGVSRLISFQSVPNMALDAGDAVTVTRPDGTSEVHLIDSLTIPLASGGEQTAETRARDWSAE